MEELQLSELFPEFDRLQCEYGNPKLRAIYGAGQIHAPRLMLVFMNPTARNIASFKDWQGIRTLWLGTKNIWKMFYELKIIKSSDYDFIRNAKPHEWTPGFAQELYEHIAEKNVYLTNMAKCNQDDARPLGNETFKAYLDLLKIEIKIIQPEKIVVFGNQVASILLNKNIRVSDYESSYEILNIDGQKYKVYPTYYPVGQGMRNMGKAVKRITELI